MKQENSSLTAKAVPAAADIPDLLDGEAVGRVLSGDEKPFFFTLAFPNRVKGTGGIYDGYHATVLDGIKTRNKAITGSKSGHDSQDRDFYFLGGTVGENETVYKGYVPPVDMRGGSNEGLIRAINSGTAEFSIVADVTKGGDGKENGVEVYKKELGVPVIDLVDRGAQQQRVGNAEAETEKEIFDLIAVGEIDYTGESDTPISGGKVSKMFFVKNQNTKNKALAGNALRAIAKRKNQMDEELKKTLADLTAKVDTLAKAQEKQAAPAPSAEADNGKDNGKKKNAALDEIRNVLALDEDADIDEIMRAIKALSDADAEVLAENAAGGKYRKNGQVNAAYSYAFDRIRGVKVRNRKPYIDETLKNDSVFIDLKKVNAEGDLGGGVSGRKTNLWGR